MKKLVIFLGIILISGGIAAGIFFFHSRPEPGQEFRANLTDAQKMLVMLRRAETAYQQSSNVYKYISAKKIGGKVIYSEGWSSLNLPEVETRTGFNFECLPSEGICQATEIGKAGPVGNGIRIDIESGAYECLGSYKPVTTQGFDGSEIVIGCRN